MTDLPPTRLCCGKRHWDIICPDGKVMCQICFERFDLPDLYRDVDETVWDICKTCGKYNECVQCRQAAQLYQCLECSKLFCHTHWGNHDNCLM